MIIQEPVVFIVENDAAVRDFLTLTIEQAGIKLHSFKNAKVLLLAFRPDFFGCIIIDVKMPEMDRLQLQEGLSQRKIYRPSESHR